MTNEIVRCRECGTNEAPWKGAKCMFCFKGWPLDENARPICLECNGALTDQMIKLSPPLCGDCRRKRVKGTYSAKVKCLVACTSALGPDCTCSCGGKNHGIDHATKRQTAEQADAAERAVIRARIEAAKADAETRLMIERENARVEAAKRLANWTEQTRAAQEKFAEDWRDNWGRRRGLWD